MKYFKHFITFLILYQPIFLIAQNNEIQINAFLNTKKHELQIEQKIIYYNQSTINLDTIYFHNWPNAYKDKNTPLAKRLIESYHKSFHFSAEKNRGFTAIKNILLNNNQVNYFIPTPFSDVIGIALPKTLKPQQFITLNINYTVKIPLNQYTGYGRTKDAYYLKYWYIVPALILTQLAVARLHKVTPHRLIAAGALLAAVSFLPLLLTTSKAGLIISFSLAAAGLGMLIPAAQAMAANAVGASEQGLAAGTITAAQGLASVASPLTVTVLYQWDWRLPFVLACAALIALCLLTAGAMPWRRQVPVPPAP